MDPTAEFKALCDDRTPLKKAARHYGLTLDEMGRALHYARIAKVMKQAADRQAQRDLAEKLRCAAGQVPQRPEQAGRAVMPAPPAQRWCLQCERRVTAAQADACTSRFCKAKAAAA